MNREIETNTGIIKARIMSAATAAMKYECDHCTEATCPVMCGKWHAFRNTTIRVLRRFLSVNTPGDAPAAIYHFAKRLADTVVLDGDESYSIDKALRLLIRKAQKGKLTTPVKIKCPQCHKNVNPSKFGYISMTHEAVCIWCFGNSGADPF